MSPNCASTSAALKLTSSLSNSYTPPPHQCTTRFRHGYGHHPWGQSDDIVQNVCDHSQSMPSTAEMCGYSQPCGADMYVAKAELLPSVALRIHSRAMVAMTTV